MREAMQTQQEEAEQWIMIDQEAGLSLTAMTSFVLKAIDEVKLFFIAGETICFLLV